MDSVSSDCERDSILGTCESCSSETEFMPLNTESCGGGEGRGEEEKEVPEDRITFKSKA